MKDKNIIRFIKTVRESSGGSIATYTMGNCYQFYEILKCIYPEAEAYYAGHVWTKIEDEFYDIRGKLKQEYKERYDLQPIVDEEHIKTLSQNKSLDKDRQKMNESSPYYNEDRNYWERYEN